MDSRLVALGDRLERNVRAEIAATRNIVGGVRDLLRNPNEEEIMDTTEMVETRRTRRPRRVVVLAAAAAVVVLGGGVAAAAGVFDTGAVERGMPGGTVMLAGTHPKCITTDGVAFQCTLEHTPTGEVAPGDFLDTIEVMVGDDSRVSGGCRSQDADGLHWTCYLGQRAVDEGMIGQDFLGQKAGPGVG